MQNISNISALIFGGKFTWVVIKKKACAFGGFSLAKMSGIVNSGLYCYFNSLIQSLANSMNVHRLLEEHVNAIEVGDSKYSSFHVNIQEKYSTEKFGTKIRNKYSVDLDLVF